jgi:hypothetical protein
MLCGRHKTPQVVPHDGFENHFNAQLVDLLREIERVRIHAEGREQLGANRNDLGVHP